MNLQSLLVCSDERILRVLRRVLDELGIEVEHCADPTAATKLLARQTFEAVIVDCAEEGNPSLLKSIRRGQRNKKSVAVAIIDEQTALRRAFEMGAHFVVFKPISCERAKSSFRAAKSLMKRERRRSVRVSVRIPVSLRFQNGEAEYGSIFGLSEGGISVELSFQRIDACVLGFCFTLPDTTILIEASGLIAWQNSDRRVGIRFTKLSDSARQSLKEWLLLKSGEKADPPIRCAITDISLGGCFLQTDSPFPIETRVELFLCVADCRFRTEGKVRIMHPELGMGVEFAGKTEEHRRLMEAVIHRLTLSRDPKPEALVEPEGLDWGDSVEALSEDSSFPTVREPEELEDPLLRLLRTGTLLSKDQFVVDLEKQRRASPERHTSN